MEPVRAPVQSRVAQEEDMTPIPFGARCACILIVGVSMCTPALGNPKGDRALWTANGLLERRLHEEAIAEYRVALQILDDPAARDEARYGLAVALFRSGDHEHAIEAIDELETGNEFRFAAESGIVRAHALHRLGRFAESADAFEVFSRHYPDHPSSGTARSLAVESLNRAGDHRAAIRLHDRISGMLDEDTLDSESAKRARFFAAVSHATLGAHADATRLFASLADAEGDAISQQSSLRLARSLEASGRFKDAGPAFRIALKASIAPVRHDAMLGLASLSRTLGDPDEAVELLAALRREAPNYRQGIVSLELGIASLELEKPEDAASHFGDAAKDKGLGDSAAYWLAQTSLRIGDAKAAAARLGEALEAYPESPLQARMAYDLADSLAQDGETERSRRAFESFRKKFSDHPLVADALYTETTLALSAGNFSRAIRLAERLLRRHPEHELAADAAFVLGEAHYRGDDADAALRVFRELLSADELREGLRGQAEYRLGMSLYRAGQSAEAQRVLERVVEADNDAVSDADTTGTGTDMRFAPALTALGSIAFQDNEWERAAAYFRRALEADDSAGPNRDDTGMKLGLALARLDETEEAMAWFEPLAHEGGPHAVHATFEIGQSLEQMGRDDEAAQVFSKLLEEHPGSRFEGHALRRLGAIALRRGNPEAGIRHLADAASILGDDTPLRIDRARGLLDLQRADDAVALLSPSEPGEPAEQIAWRGIACVRAGRSIAACTEFDRLEIDSLDPGLAELVRLEHARGLNETGRAEDAQRMLAALGASARSNGITSRATIELASIMIDESRHAEAIDVLDSLFESASLPAALCDAARYQAAWARFSLGEHQAVIDLLDGPTPACDSYELTTATRFLLAESLLAVGRASAAADRFAVIVLTAPESAEHAPSLLRLGEAQGAAQRWADSAAAYTTYLETYPDSSDWFRARFGLGWAAENAGDPEGAMSHYRQVTDSHRGATAARAQFQIGECLFAQGRHEEAVREFLRVDILYAESEWSAAALYEAGRCFEAIGKIGEARSQYREVVGRFAESEWAGAARERLSALGRGRVPGQEGD